MKNPLKTVVLALTFVLLLGLAPHALAQSSFVPLAEIPGLTSGDVANSSDLASFFNNLYKYLIGLAAILAIIEIIWGGLEYSTQDNISKKSDGKARIYQALSGLLLVLAPALVFGIINPSILNLRINLTPLPTQPGKSSVGTQIGAIPVVRSATGCTVSGALFQKASCPTEQARDQWVASCTNGATTKAACTQTDPATKQCADKTFAASCDTMSGPITGPFLFIDISSGSVLNILSRKSLHPVAVASNGSDNGGLVMNFVNACLKDGGAVCYEESLFDGSVVCPTMSPQPASQSNKCYSKNLKCRDPQIADLVIKDEKCTRTQSFTIIK